VPAAAKIEKEISAHAANAREQFDALLFMRILRRSPMTELHPMTMYMLLGADNSGDR